MKDEHDNLTPGAKSARKALEELGAVPAEPNYRARVREGFVGRTLAGSRRSISSTSRSWRVASLAAIAAAIIAIAGIVWMNRGESWRVVSSTGPGPVVVDGQPISPTDSTTLSGAIHPGVRILVPEGTQLDLSAAGTLLIQVTAGTEATLPRPPGRWWRRYASGHIWAGELRITTGPRFHGARLSVGSPDARVDVSGTTIAVIKNPFGTCLCVFEGTARIAPAGRSPEPLGAGFRRQLFNDGRPPLTEPLRPMEQMKLSMLRDQGRAKLGRGR